MQRAAILARKISCSAAEPDPARSRPKRDERIELGIEPLDAGEAFASQFGGEILRARMP